MFMFVVGCAPAPYWNESYLTATALTIAHGPRVCYPTVSLPQPGKTSLMLKMLLSPGGVSQKPQSTSLARQQIVKAEREQAVQAYRALKKLRQQQRVSPPQLLCHTSQRKAEVRL